jgi:hypothetical protein
VDWKFKENVTFIIFTNNVRLSHHNSVFAEKAEINIWVYLRRKLEDLIGFQAFAVIHKLFDCIHVSKYPPAP